jgi:hypothetical protein
MRRAVVAVVVWCASFALAQGALAVPPAITTVSVAKDRRPSATFSAPNASSLTITFARRPDLSSDGGFLPANVVKTDFLTADEIQAGAWTFESELDPGTYYVLLQATPSFTPCSLPDGTYSPGCANGASSVTRLVVQAPTVRYSATVHAPRSWTTVQLRLKARPLGIEQRYRVCFRSRTERTICAPGVLDGFSWNSAITDFLSVSKHDLPSRATLTWYVGKAKVARTTFAVQRPD